MALPTDHAQLLMMKARTALLASAPFFGALTMELSLVPSSGTKTCATDGVSLFYNPDFVESLTFDELKAVLAHEVMHCAAGHHTRRGKRDPKKWNIAADAAINPIIRDAGFALPADAIFFPHLEGRSAEAIYAALPDGEDGGGGAKDDDAGGGSWGEVRDLPAGEGDQGGGAADESAMQQSRQDWQVAALLAESIAKRAGHGSSSAERLLDEIKHPPAPWRSILRQFMASAAKSDYSWNRPNRRHIANGIYLPSLHSQELGEIVVAIDTSGSCSHVQEVFCEELQEITRECEPSRVHLVYCDSKVQRVDTFEKGETIERRTVIGGGTDFRPVFEWIEENGIDPACCIYLTDLDGAAPTNEPDYPVLWASVAHTKAPWGEVVTVDY